MKRHKFFIAIALAAVVLSLTVSTAAAAEKVVKVSKKVFLDGSYAVTTETVSAATIKKPIYHAATSTQAAYITYSTISTKTVRQYTKYVSWLGSPIMTYTSGSSWQYDGRRVRTVVVLAPSFKYHTLFIVKNGIYVSPVSWRYYNGYSNGEAYHYNHGQFTQQILKIGQIVEMDPLHQYWVRGNGTYRAVAVP